MANQNKEIYNVKPPKKDGDLEEYPTLSHSKENISVKIISGEANFIKKYVDGDNKRRRFFSEDSRMGASMKSLRMEDVIEEDVVFSYKYYLEFLTYHVLFYMLLGPLSVPIIWMISGKPAVYNQLYLTKDISILLLFQYFLFIANFLSIFLYYFFYESLPHIYGVEVYMALTGCFIRMCIISSKYGTFSPEKMKIFKSRILDLDENQSEWTFANWRQQTDGVIENELRNTFIRLNIDPSILYFKFFGDVNKSHIDEIEEANIGGCKKNVYKQKNMLVNPAGVKFVDTDYCLRDKEMIVEKGKLLRGYGLAKCVIQKVRKLQVTYKSILITATVLSFVHAIIPFLFRYYEKGTVFGENSLETGVIISISLVNQWYFNINLQFILYSVVDFSRQKQMLSQLSNLISPTKVALYRTKKYYPTINFFCPISLRTWAVLQRIFREYGKKFKLRMEMNNLINLMFYLIIIIVCALSVFKVITNFGMVTTAVFTFEIIILILASLFMMFQGAILNEFFNIHGTLIKKVKDVHQDLLSFIDIYFNEEDPFRSENDVYNEGINSLSKMYETIPHKKRKNLISSTLQNLIKICNATKEELEVSEKFEPFKIFGVKASLNLIQSISAALGSIMIAGFQYVLRN